MVSPLEAAATIVPASYPAGRTSSLSSDTEAGQALLFVVVKWAQHWCCLCNLVQTMRQLRRTQSQPACQPTLHYASDFGIRFADQHSLCLPKVTDALSISPLLSCCSAAHRIPLGTSIKACKGISRQLHGTFRVSIIFCSCLFPFESSDLITWQPYTTTLRLQGSCRCSSLMSVCVAGAPKAAMPVAHLKSVTMTGSCILPPNGAIGWSRITATEGGLPAAQQTCSRGCVSLNLLVHAAELRSHLD